MSEFIVAVGLFLVFEGLIYALAPGSVKKLAQMLPEIPNQQLRNFGLVAIILGVGIVWLIRG